MNLKKICLCILCFALLLLSPLGARAETVRFPFFVDFPLLRALVINSVFDGPNQRAEVLNNHTGCRQITLSGPSFEEKDALVSLETIMSLVPTPYRHRAQQMLQSMRPGNITTSTRGLRVEILADAEVVYEAETEPQPLAASELKAMVHTWEALDEFLVQLITSLTVSPSLIQQNTV